MEVPSLVKTGKLRRADSVVLVVNGLRANETTAAHIEKPTAVPFRHTEVGAHRVAFCCRKDAVVERFCSVYAELLKCIQNLLEPTNPVSSLLERNAFVRQSVSRVEVVVVACRSIVWRWCL